MALKLSLQDRLAVMMTAAGSQRELARRIGGVSHQQVGRWLTIGQTTPQGAPSRVREPKAADIAQAIEAAWTRHVADARAQAQRDGIPFSAQLPVLAKRREALRDGTPSPQVVIDHTHRLRDDLRDAAITLAHRSDKYVAVTVRSIVNMRKYYQRADGEYRNYKRQGLRRRRNHQQMLYREQMKAEMQKGIQTKPVFTQYVEMHRNFPTDLILQNISDRLQQKHEPATGDPGTKLADSIVLQLKTNRGKPIEATKHAPKRSAAGKAKRSR